MFDGDLQFRDDVSAGINTVVHFSLLGLVAWLSGHPFLFPSLGPSAYLMATGEQPREEGAYHIVGGHALAVVAGWLSVTLLADGASATTAFAAEPLSEGVFRLALSAMVAMLLTTVGMLWTKTNHPAACATALIVGLGLMTAVVELVVIVLAVALLVVVHYHVVDRLTKAWGLGAEDARPSE